VSAGPERWAVVGGGMLGLTLALRLAGEGREVTLIESAATAGGLASPWRLETPDGPVTWDRHYHVTLLSDTALRGLLAELGLEPELRWGDTRTGYWAQERLSPVSTPSEFLALPGLSPVAKARLAATIAVGGRIRDWHHMEQIPVAQWLTRWSGRATFERFWLPLLRAKLGEAWPDTSAAFLWATIRRLTAARRQGLGRERFGYVAGGYAKVLDRLAARLAERGVTLRTGATVERVEAASGGGLTATVAGAEPEHFDRVAVTTDAPTAVRICGGLSVEERERLQGIRYQGIVCASLLLRAPLSPYYLTYLFDEMPFTAVVEMTALVDPAELGGHCLVYLPRYVAPDDPLLDAPDAEIRRSFVAALARMHPSVDDEAIAAFRVSRVRRVFAIPTIGYSARVPPMDTSVPGLHLVGSAQIVNGTLNVNETVQLAEAAASRLCATASAVPARVES